LPNDSVEGERLMPGAVPVPVSATVLGLPVPLWVTERLALLLPVDPGVNVTLIVQVAFGARAALQVLLCANCALSVPVTDTPLTVRFALPVLVIVTVCALLVVLIS
jgi:hypothetical protein